MIRRAAGVAVMLAVMLIAAPMGFSAWSKWVYPTQVQTKVENTLINAVYGGMRDFCTKTLGHLCEAILVDVSDVEAYMVTHNSELELKTVTTAIERQQAKAVLGVPTLNIYMSDGVRHQLLERRKIAFRNGGSARRDGLKDWFNAEIVSDRGQKTVKVRLRLKGKGIDHFDDPKRMSFRVKVKNGDRVFGMSEFSIHRPRVRQGAEGAIAQDVMKRFDVLAANTIFADIRINNELVGIMGLEESFTKEMLEAQGRRDSVIVAVDDDWEFQQNFLNRKNGHDDSALRKELLKTFEWDKWSGNDLMTPLSLRDYPVQIFNGGQLASDVMVRQATVDGVSIFRDVIDGRLPGSVVYDYNQLARFWIIAHMFSGHHGMLFVSNRRHYFNPITRRLEPVSYDLDVKPLHPCLSGDHWVFYSHVEAPCVVSDLSIRSIWDDPRFWTIVWKEASAIQEKMSSPKFKEWFASRYYKYSEFLRIDTMRAPGQFDSSREQSSLVSQEQESELLSSYLEKNLSDFLLRVREKYLIRTNAARSLDMERQESVVDDIVSPSSRELMEKFESLHTHIRPFVFRSPQHIRIEVKNLTLDSVFIDSVFYTKSSSSSLVPIGIEIPAYTVGSTDHIFQTEVPASKLVANASLWIKYAHKSMTYTRPMIPQDRNHQKGYESSHDTSVWFKTNSVQVDEKTRTISFGPGHYTLKYDIQTRPGWQVEFHPGAVLEFRKGARLRVNGPVYLLGEKDAPVHLMIESDLSPSLRSWGGLLVVNAAAQSRMRHVLVTGSARTDITGRQDSNGLTGCITFYKSDLTIEHARFSGLPCEDALNIVHSTFDFDDLEISDSGADAFDCDFSNGKITNSEFRNNKNDGLDLSGSNVELRFSNFIKSGDKAISVGEGSILEIGDIKITGASAGIVSKDQSVVNVWNASITNVNTGLMAYIKKPGWGPPRLNCQSCSFKNVESMAAKQSRSAIIVGDVEVGASPFSRKQLRIAGFVRDNP